MYNTSWNNVITNIARRWKLESSYYDFYSHIIIKFRLNFTEVREFHSEIPKETIVITEITVASFMRGLNHRAPPTWIRHDSVQHLVSGKELNLVFFILQVLDNSHILKILQFKNQWSGLQHVVDTVRTCSPFFIQQRL